MELQLALDMIPVEKGLALAKSIEDLVDIVELGTPFSYKNGADMLARFKQELPRVRVLADYKIMDGGYGITEMGYKAGADIVTVSARTWDDTIKQAIQCAADYGKEVLVDLMGVPDAEIAQRAREVDSFKPTYINVHRAVTVAGSTSPEKSLQIARENVKHAKLAVAGGLDLDTLPRVIPYADMLIVGSAITAADDPRAVAQAMRHLMEAKA